jgi:hypothetical protein
MRTEIKTMKLKRKRFGGAKNETAKPNDGRCQTCDFVLPLTFGGWIPSP